MVKNFSSFKGKCLNNAKGYSKRVIYNYTFPYRTDANSTSLESDETLQSLDLGAYALAVSGTTHSNFFYDFCVFKTFVYIHCVN